MRTKSQAWDDVWRALEEIGVYNTYKPRPHQEEICQALERLEIARLTIDEIDTLSYLLRKVARSIGEQDETATGCL